MRNMLRRWLGVDNDELRICALEMTLMAKKNPTLAEVQERTDAHHAVQILGALMDYLDLDVRRGFRPDYSRFREPEPMREVFEVYPRKVKK